MVQIAGQISDQIDPLLDHSSLSLFPRSFTSPPHPDISTAGSVYSHLRSMVSRSPENLLKQAKAVIHDSLNLFKNDKTSEMASDGKTNDTFVTNDNNPQVKRRPALGLKQAKFSAKSMPRQLDTVTEPSIDIDKLEDPQKFFEAYERMENAKKEMRKLRGEPLKQLDQNRFSLPPRSRRPGLLGKSATYRPQFDTSMATNDNDGTLLSSEEAFVNGSVSPVRRDVGSETDDVATLPNTKVHDSPTSEFDKLFSCDYDALDATGVLNLLHEKLDVKVHKFDKLSISNLCDIGPPKSMSSVEAISNITDPSSHLNGIRKTIHGDLANGSQSNESRVQLPKSPLASISMLNRHISKLASSVDPFSANNIDIDSSPHKNSSERPVGGGAEVGQTGQSTTKSKVRIDESNVGQPDGVESQEDLYEIVRSPDHFDYKEKENEVVKDVECLHEEGNFENSEKSIVNKDEECVLGEASITEDIVSKEPTKKTEGTKKTLRGKKPKVSSQASPANETVDKEMEANTESNAIVPNKKRKQIDDPPSKKNGSRRSSLYGVAGTKWEAGVRRSSRIKMRPLEYWKGERFIYGRVHNSLVTVIGVKYASPSNEAEPRIKVKSFVSDEHKDIMESAALY